MSDPLMLEAWAEMLQEELLDVAADVQEGGSGHYLPYLTARLALVRSLVSGEQVVVSRAEITALQDRVEHWYYAAPDTEAVDETMVAMMDTLTRWLTPPSEGSQS
jgi:hypothetical protein